MLQGVHAETIVFTAYPQARGLLASGDWPLIGTASKLGGRDVKLGGTHCRRFRLHATDPRDGGKKAVSCQLELRNDQRPFAPQMKVELTFVPDGRNTRIRLTGSTARDLSPDTTARGTTSVRMANEYARALLDQFAKTIEERSKTTHRA